MTDNINDLKKLNQNEKAFLLSLVLSVTAPTESKANECIAMAESIAITFTTKQVEKLKKIAEKRLTMDNPFIGLADSLKQNLILKQFSSLNFYLGLC